MTVRELIEALSHEDPDAIVVVCCDTELGDYVGADGVVRGLTDAEGMRFHELRDGRAPAGFVRPAIEVS